MPAFRAMTMRVVHVEDGQRADNGKVQPPDCAMGDHQGDQRPDENCELGDAGSDNNGEAVLDTSERVLLQAADQFAQRTVPFDRDEGVAKNEVLVKTMLLEQFA